ncbi:CoA transferase [Variovorax paradoxus]|nr:CaiB/BaiF CoA-transferase family protein [Variovorax paradoxus]MBT2304869.1 CoA transferase [Variovorax paradoxus]
MPSSSTPLPGPLSGLVVIDLTRALSGPYCTLQLAELGARVIKVESPEGDEARWYGPEFDGTSVYFRSINRDKESIVLDLKEPEDRGIFEEMLSVADVLVENFRPGVMERLGFDWNRLSPRFPGLVMASISGFGQDGPYRTRAAYDMVAQAMGGIVSITGTEEGQMTRVGVSIGDLAAGLFATIAIQAALLERVRTGKGSRIDVSMLDCQVALLENAVARFHATGQVPKPEGSRHPLVAPFDIYQAADAPLAICVGNEAQFAKLAAALGRPEWVSDPKLSSPGRRSENQAALKKAMEEALKAKSRCQWIAELEQAGIPTGPVNTVADLAADPQVLARGMLIRPKGERDGMKYAAMPYKMSSIPPDRMHRAAPAVGADRDAVLSTLKEALPHPKGETWPA